MASTSSNDRSSSDVPTDYARLKLLWLNFLNSDDDNAGNAASKVGSDVTRAREISEFNHYYEND